MADTTIDQTRTASGRYETTGAGIAALPMPQLVLAWGRKGKRVGERAVLSGGEVLVGRDEGLLLFPGGHLGDESLLSRRHACLAEVGGEWFIRDLGSRNGTWVNGVRVEKETVLAHGDVVRVGEVLAVFRRQPVPGPFPESAEFVGISAAAVSVRQQVGMLAPALVPVLLQGESGTGKEVAAHALHRLSARKGPLVAVDCPNIPESLWESEMFGYEKGAFSGAQARRAGRIEQADKGTLFLDEIGELPLAMQPKLLRVLETGKVARLGGGSPVDVDVRLVAATNRNLAAEVAAGRFRADLFARVAHAVVTLPPLRDRREDVPLLLSRFLARTGCDAAMPVTDLERLMLHPWPLNVRELVSLAELLAATVPADGGPLRLGPSAMERLETYARSAPGSGQQPAGLAQQIAGSPCDVPPRSVSDGLRLAGKAAGRTQIASVRPASALVSASQSASQSESESSPAELTGELLDKLLRECDGNVTTVAEMLGKHRFQVYRLLERFGLDLEEYRCS